MKLDTSKTLIWDLADENEQLAKQDEFDFETLNADAAKKKKEEAFDVWSVFWDESLDEDYTPPKSKINDNTLLITVIIAIVVTIWIFAYFFTK